MRRPLARADQKILFAVEQEGERERPVQARQCRRNGLERTAALLHLVTDQMCHDFGVGIRLELRAVRGELFAQLAEVLDDAVVDHGDGIGRMRMRIGLIRPAVGCPARVGDADPPVQALATEPSLQIRELALGATALKASRFERGYPGGIIAAVFEPLERIEQMAGNRLFPQNPHDPAHCL